MIDRSEVSKALAKAIAYKQCGKDNDALAWARKQAIVRSTNPAGALWLEMVHAQDELARRASHKKAATAYLEHVETKPSTDIIV